MKNEHDKFKKLVSDEENPVLVSKAMKTLKLNHTKLMRLLDIHGYTITPIIVSEPETQQPGRYEGVEFDYIIIKK